jgi:hypothetical protein
MSTVVVNRNDFFIEALLRKNAYVAVVLFLFVKKRSSAFDGCVVENVKKSPIE